MGTLMRVYIFICFLGITSMIGIAILTYNTRNAFKIQEKERMRHAEWRHRRKPEAQKNYRDIKDIALEDPSKQLESTYHNKDGIFNLRAFSDSDQELSRNTASPKDDTEITRSYVFSIFEESNSEPHLEGVNSTVKQAGPVVKDDAVTINIQQEYANTNNPNFQAQERLVTAKTQEKPVTSQKTVLKDKMEAVDIAVKKEHSSAGHKTSKPNEESASQEKLMSKTREAQNRRLRHYASLKTGMKSLSKRPVHGPPVMVETKPKNFSHFERGYSNYSKTFYTKRRRVSSTWNKTFPISEDDLSKMDSEPLIKPITINQKILKLTSNFSQPLFTNDHVNLTRILTNKNMKSGPCKPHNNLAMMKTHKCSSSTLQNILYRWGDDHNLTFVLPKEGPYIGHPQPFNIRYTQRAAGDKYNILANHARYNEDGLKRVMPGDTLYFTVLRDPVKQFESAFTYYKFDKRFGVTGLRAFLEQPEVYFQREPVFPRQAGRNQMLYDLGLDARFLDDTSSEVRDYIAMIERNFHLVMIAEFFEESLILLKDLLCWSLDDIVYFNQNARSQSSVRRITPTMRRQILEWNSADAAMYNHFNKTLWEKIRNYGLERMRDKVVQLQLRNEILKKKCIGGKMESHDPRMWYPLGIKVDSFVMNPSARGERLCEQLVRPELSYIGILKAKQRLFQLRSDDRDELLSRHSRMKNVYSRRFKQGKFE